MTISFTPSVPGGAGTGGAPHWGGSIAINNPVLDPFSFRKHPDPSGIRVVKVSEKNLAGIAWRVLKESRETVVVPYARDAIVIGGIRYDVGEWMVEERDKSKNACSYRHATQAEVDLYNLEG